MSLKSLKPLTSSVDHPIIVKIHGLLFHEGQGVGRSEDGKVYFVDQACPGDVVEIQPYKETKSYAHAKIVKIIESSSERVEPRCEVFNTCGGCSLQHVHYDAQLQEKQKVLERYLSKKAIHVNLESFEPSENIYNYRNRMEVHIEHGQWGLYEKKSNRLVFPKTCPIVTPEVHSFLNQKFSEDGHYHIGSSGVHKRTRGTDGIFDQVNSEINLKLKLHLQKKLEAITDNVTDVYDLYAGSGNYSLFLAPKFTDLRFTAVELSRKLVALGQKKSKDTYKIQWVCSDVDKYLKSLKTNFSKNSVFVLNPPRTGLEKTMISTLLNLKPKYFIYISCNPMTLFRDIDALSTKFTLQSLKGFDMFPQTMHFETLALLKQVES